jgi:hypothetical protein
MSDVDVLTAARLFGEDYPELHERILSGLLTTFADGEAATIRNFAYAKLGVGVGDPWPDVLAGWLTDAEAARLDRAEQARLILVRVWPVWQSADWRPAAVLALRESGRWDEFAELVARADEATEETRYRLKIPPPAICAKLFLRHWRQPGTTPPIEMARRGFTSPEELGAAVRRFFALDVRSGRR